MTHEFNQGRHSRKEKPGISSIPGYILSGGVGSRMEALTRGQIPKGLVEIEPGKVLLDYVLDLLDKSGVEKVILCVSHQSKKIIAYYKNGAKHLNINYSIEESPLGVIRTFETAVRNMNTATDFFLLHGDEIITNVSLVDMYNFHLSHTGIATGLLSRNPQAKRTVIMKLEDSGLVSDSIRESKESNPGYLSSLGLFIFRPEIKNEVGRFATWEEMVKTLAKEGKLFGFPSDALFFNINTPSDIADFLRRHFFPAHPAEREFGGIEKD